MKKYKEVIMYGVLLAVLMLLLKWLEMRFIIMDRQLEVYSGSIAVLFTALGIWLAIKLRRPKIQTVIVEKHVPAAGNNSFLFNKAEVQRLNLSKRELEVLQLMAEGLSNREIAGRLFVSLNTVKTHCGQIFEKMEVKRRTQAVDMARTLRIIP